MKNNLHYERLELIARNGFSPKVIYDIGAFIGLWSHEMKSLFPDAQFYLFEANEEARLSLEQQSFPFFIELLGDEERVAPFYRTVPSPTGSSVFCEASDHFQGDMQNLRMRTLSSVAKQYDLPPPDLIKMDVQGGEGLILKGSASLICHAKAIILETHLLQHNPGAPLINEIVIQMDMLGYRILDVLELHYTALGELLELDLLFVKKSN